jgi:hypothetical protein
MLMGFLQKLLLPFQQPQLYDFSDYILVWYLIFILLYIVVVEREAGASEENPSTCYNSLTNLHKVISSTPTSYTYINDRSLSCIVGIYAFQ